MSGGTSVPVSPSTGSSSQADATQGTVTAYPSHCAKDLEAVANDVLFRCIERAQLGQKPLYCDDDDDDDEEEEEGNENEGEKEARKILEEEVGSVVGKSFGRLLDAGTGVHSLRWIASLCYRQGEGECDGEESSVPLIDSYTAITADEGMRQSVLKEAKRLGVEDRGEIIIGNWAPTYHSSTSSSSSSPASSPPSKKEHSASSSEAPAPSDDLEGSSTATQTTSKGLCEGEMYDTILADYLVGAMDGFSPHYQDMIFPRLVQHLKPGGRLYVVGLNPIPDRVTSSCDDPKADVICRVTRMRDACILLAGHRCYREYPIDWIERNLRRAGMNVVQSSKYSILYSQKTIVKQLNVARSKLPLFASKSLADQMSKAIDDLEKESEETTEQSRNKRLRLGFDYVVAAELPPPQR